MDKSLSKKLSILGFIMTSFMVFYHTGFMDNSYAIGELDLLLNDLLSGFITNMGVVVMSYFFAVTGFLLFRDLSIENYSRKIKNRVFSLLIPYLVWQLIYLLYEIARGRYTGEFLYRTFAFVQWPYAGILWYVYAIFFLALLSPLLLFIFKRKRVSWLLIIAVTVILGALYSDGCTLFEGIKNYGLVPNLMSYMPAYLAGAFYGKFYPDLKEKESLKYLVSLLAVVFAFDSIIDALFYSTTVKMLPILLLAVLPCDYSGEFRPGKLSFLMYASHGIILGTLIPLANGAFLLFRRYLPVPLSLFNLITYIFGLVSVLLFSALLHYVLKRYLPRALKLLTGGRG